MSENRDQLKKLTENAKEVIIQAYTFAKEGGYRMVLPEHIFLAVLSLDKGLASKFLKSLGIDIDKTIQSIKMKMPKGGRFHENIELSDPVKEIIKSAYLLSHEYGHVYVGTEHILLALLQNKNLEFVKELELAGLDFNSIREKLFEYATYAPGVFMKTQQEKEDETAVMNYFGRSLNALNEAGKLMPIIGRDKEIIRLVRILSRQTKNNPILVGEAGVGKTAIVEGLVQRIDKGDVPQALKDLEVYQIDIASIIAGSKVRGDVEQRLLALISEASTSSNKVLFIDEIHMIIGAGATGSDRSMDIANILKPRLTDGSIQVIGATTLAEYRQYFEEDSALSRRFQPIMVDEISVEDGIKILRGVKSRFEEYHGVKILDTAVKAAVYLSNRYITDRFLPDKAIDVVDEAAATEKLKREAMYSTYKGVKDKLKDLSDKKDRAVQEKSFEKAQDIRVEEERIEDEMKEIINKERKLKDREEYKVDEDDIKSVIGEWTGIPLETMTLNEKKSLKNIGRKIQSRIIGQKEAIERITSTLKRARVGISDEKRPMASFLFLGPTGVGKTEMAKSIAKEFFGSEKALFQVDMSEYMEQHSVAKIIGAPPGYVGYQEGGQLTEKVRKKPYSVVLFDEIEKAHPELLNILLQVLEEGHITDSKGRNVNFKNTIIIMTSNIGAEDIGKDKVLGFSVASKEEKIDEAYEKMRDRLIEDLKKRLRPEFINRIDEVVIFRGLSEDDAERIVQVQIGDLKKRLKSRKVEISVPRDVVKLIAREGFSEEYGARNLKRKVQELIENPLSDVMLENEDKKTLNIKISREGRNLKLKGS
ncbi:MAG: ATP-dependent Clp protease ATP-binding subunit [Atribacterota bacterium]|nr:ATP-dependent Clp protease ATP-binding subunit [Atribacterota bacterium]